MPWKNLMLLIGTLLFFPACSTLKSPTVLPGSTISADQFMANISGINDRLKTFQGVGKFRLRSEQGILTSRVAWIGDKNSKFRIEVLGPGGRSQASFATDGNWFYVITRNPLRFHKRQSKNASLNRLISIPIKTDDLHRLLSGKIPIRPHHSVSALRDKSDGGVVLVLKKRWLGTVEKIFLDNKGSQVKKIEVFSTGGTLAYDVTFQGYKTVGEYRIPSRLLISDAGRVTFDLDIHKFNPDINLADSAFVLEPPESKR
jgi:hypothetical protein